MPFCPVNQRTPRRSNVAVFRLAPLARVGRGNRRTFSVRGSTRTIAFRPPSEIQGAPSGPTITPCGAEPLPSAVSRERPFFGFSHPSSPEPCAVYQTPPSRAGATSCGCVPLGTGYSRTRSWLSPAVAAPADAASASRTRARAARRSTTLDTRPSNEWFGAIRFPTVRDPNGLLTRPIQLGRYGGANLAPLHVTCRPRSQGGRLETHATTRPRHVCRRGPRGTRRARGRAHVDRLPRRPE